MNTKVLDNYNWENLVSLYNALASRDKRIVVTQSPVLCYVSSSYCWPNFTLLDSASRIDNRLVEDISMGIEEGKLSQFILLHPAISAQDDTAAIFNQVGIKQIDVWTGIAIDTSSTTVEDVLPDNFHVSIVDNDIKLEHWHRLLSEHMFKNQSLPIKSLESDDIVLYVGYENDIPVSTVMLYIDEQNIAGTYMGVVDPKFRLKGYGKSIHIEAVKTAFQRGCRYVIGQSSRRGLRPWISMGYTAIGMLDIYAKLM